MHPQGFLKYIRMSYTLSADINEQAPERHLHPCSEPVLLVLIRSQKSYFVSMRSSLGEIIITVPMAIINAEKRIESSR